MTRALLLAAGLALPLGTAAAQASDPTLAPTAAAFEADVATVVRLATAAALVHERTGVFPADAYGLLGSEEAGATGARALSLSALDMTDGLVAQEAHSPSGGTGVGAFTVVPLPAPYVRDDEHLRVVLARRADGVYEAHYEITRHRDPDLGGGRRLYDAAGRYAVQRGVGTLCIRPAEARAALAAGTFQPDPARWTDRPFAVRVVPPGADAPVYFEQRRP